MKRFMKLSNLLKVFTQWWRGISKIIQRNLPQGTGTKVGTFLIWIITISNGKISAKLYDKCGDFSFFTVCMPNFYSNIPSSAFCRIVMSKILRIARSFFSGISFYRRKIMH